MDIIYAAFIYFGWRGETAYFMVYLRLSMLIPAILKMMESMEVNL